MHTGLFVLGGVTAVSGILAIAYGVPVNEFGFGNTLIVAGTVALVGGFLLIGLGAVVRQLKLLAESGALHHGAMPVPFHAADPVKPTAQPGFQSNQYMAPTPVPPPLRLDPAPRAPAPPEPALATAPAADAGPPEWLRPKSKASSAGEQSLIEEIEASLSPQSTLQPVSPPPPLRVYDQSFDPRLTTQNRSAGPTVEADHTQRPEPAARPAPPVEHPTPSGLFDTVWPEIKPARHPETIARTRKPDPVAPPRNEAVPRDQPRPPAKDVAREPQVTAQVAAPAPEEPRVVAILKSGMIDGMAYTLYADGSIEAVLASGTVRFASIDALRFHLEQNG